MHIEMEGIILGLLFYYLFTLNLRLARIGAKGKKEKEKRYFLCLLGSQHTFGESMYVLDLIYVTMSFEYLVKSWVHPFSHVSSHVFYLLLLIITGIIRQGCIVSRSLLFMQEFPSRKRSNH